MTSGRRLVVRHAPAGAVAVEAVPHVEVLLEVVAQREVEERPPGGRELHRRRQAALDDGEVAGGEVPVQVRHERPDLDARRRLEGRRVDPRPGHHDHPQAVDPPGGLRRGSDHAPQQRLADARPADGHDAHPLVGPVAELAAELLAALASGAGSNPVT